MLRTLLIVLILVLTPGLFGTSTRSAVHADEVSAPAPTAQPESFLRWMVRASGLIGVVILLMSFYLVSVAVWMALEFRSSVVIPVVLHDEMTNLVADKHFQEAYRRLSVDNSFFGRTLAAGVRKLPSGLAAAQRAMEMTNEDETMRREHLTTSLATIGTLGPMIGLVGTVYGMIHSFQAMATSGASPEAGKLAEGISTALFATLEGVLLSVPAIALYAFFRNRIARLSLEVAIESEAMLEQFTPGIRTPHPLASAQPRPQPPKIDP
jgi:biopolymer transport protein ExbB